MTPPPSLHFPPPLPGAALTFTAHSPVLGVAATFQCDDLDDPNDPASYGTGRRCTVSVRERSPEVVRALMDAVFHPRNADGTPEVSAPPVASLGADLIAEARALAAQCSADAEARAELLQAAAQETEALARELGVTHPGDTALPKRLRAITTAASRRLTEAEARADGVRAELDATVRNADAYRETTTAESARLHAAVSDLHAQVEAAEAGLAEARARNLTLMAQVKAWENTAAERDRSSAYYRGIVVAIGEAVGPAAYVADDGSVMQDVLCAKVPELVIPVLRATAKGEVDPALTEARAEVGELRAVLAEVRAALGGVPGTPDQLLGNAVAAGMARAVDVATRNAVDLTAAAVTPAPGDTFHAGAVATRGAAADLAFRLAENNGDDIARAIIRMDLPKPSATPAQPVESGVPTAIDVASPPAASLPTAALIARAVLGPLTEPATPPAVDAPASAPAEPPVESVGPVAAEESPAVYDVVAASKGMSPWGAAGSAASKGARTPPAPPVQPVDAPPPPPPPAELTPAEEELVEKLSGASFLKDCILAARAAFPDWSAADVTAFFERTRGRVTLLRRIPSATLPDRVNTHFNILAGSGR